MKTAAVFLAALAFTNAANAADLNSRVTEGDGNAVIELRGEIFESDLEKFKSIMRHWQSEGVKVSGVRLNSPGGNLRTAYYLADLIEKSGMDTVLPPNAMCASACTVLFIAGHHKWANASARFLVHSVAIHGEETESSQAATTRMARIFKSHGAPQSVIGKMVSTPANSLSQVTNSELEQMGATVLGTATAYAPN
jgi:hypothetical protein